MPLCGSEKRSIALAERMHLLMYVRGITSGTPSVIDVPEAESMKSKRSWTEVTSERQNFHWPGCRGASRLSTPKAPKGKTLMRFWVSSHARYSDSFVTRRPTSLPEWVQPIEENRMSCGVFASVVVLHGPPSMEQGPPIPPRLLRMSCARLPKSSITKSPRGWHVAPAARRSCCVFNERCRVGGVAA